MKTNPSKLAAASNTDCACQNCDCNCSPVCTCDTNCTCGRDGCRCGDQNKSANAAKS